MALTSTGVNVGRRLAIGILQGHWTLEDLDTPSPGWAQNERDRERSAHPMPSGHNRPTMRYPDAGQPHPFRNLAREWITANPAAWEQLMAEHLEAEYTVPVPIPIAPLR